MAGHSKWANIKHRKGAQDAKRAKVFTRLIREITIAARQGGGDPEANPRLRAAVSNARGQQLPNDTIDKAIKRGTGELEGMVIEEINYEGYGPGGVAILVECADRQQEPDHRRGAPRLHQVQRQPGRQRLRVLPLRPQGPDPAGRAERCDLETVMEAAIEAGAEDVEEEDERHRRDHGHGGPARGGRGPARGRPAGDRDRAGADPQHLRQGGGGRRPGA